MQIVIDIPEEVLKTRYYTDYFGCGSHKLTETLDNGTPLPKGHGRLIDGDDALDRLDSGYDYDVIRYAPTVLEGNKED